MAHFYVAAVLAILACIGFWRLHFLDRSAKTHRQQFAEAALFSGLGIYVGGGLANWGMVAMPADLLGISGVSLTLAGLYANRFQGSPQLWAVMSSIAAVFLGLAAALGKLPMAYDEQIQTLLKLHVAFILVSSGFLASLGMVSVIYLIKERGLRTDPTGWPRRLPSLDQLDVLQLRSLQAGFVLLSVGIAFGLQMMLSGAKGSRQSDFLAMMTLAIWVFMAFTLYLRLWRGWRGHRLAIASSIVVGILLSVAGFNFGLRLGIHGG